MEINIIKNCKKKDKNNSEFFLFNFFKFKTYIFFLFMKIITAK